MRLKQISLRTAQPQQDGNCAAKLISKDGFEDFRVIRRYRSGEDLYFRALAAILQDLPVQDTHGSLVKLTEASLYQVRSDDARTARIEINFGSSPRLYHSDSQTPIRIPGLFKKRESPSVIRCRRSHTHNSTYALQVHGDNDRTDFLLFDCREKAENLYFRCLAAIYQQLFVPDAYGHAVRLQLASLHEVRNDDYELAQSEVEREAAKRIFLSSDPCSPGGVIEIPNLFRRWQEAVDA